MYFTIYYLAALVTYYLNTLGDSFTVLVCCLDDIQRCIWEFRSDRILSSLNPWRAELTLENLKYICDFYKYTMIIMYAINSWTGMKESKSLYSHFASFYMDVITYSSDLLNADLPDLCWSQRPQVAYFSLYEYPLALLSKLTWISLSQFVQICFCSEMTCAY